jgi:hypothetical protein
LIVFDEVTVEGFPSGIELGVEFKLAITGAVVVSDAGIVAIMDTDEVDGGRTDGGGADDGNAPCWITDECATGAA